MSNFSHGVFFYIITLIMRGAIPEQGVTTPGTHLS